jgi:hypothetical protein
MSTPWYEQIADIHSAHERDEFIKGMYGTRPNSQHTFLIGLMAGYFGTQYMTKKMKKSRREDR